MIRPDRGDVDQGFSGQPGPIDSIPEIVIDALPSNLVLSERQNILIGDDFEPQVGNLPDGSPSVIISNGIIQIDSTALEAERERTNQWLKNGIAAGDEKVLEVYRRNLIEEDEADQELRRILEKAFQSRNPDILELFFQFNALYINAVTAGIAERNLIREGLKPQLSRQPFTFQDKGGRILAGDDDLDIVFSRREGRNNEFKIIIGSKKGIDSIHLPQELPAAKFEPDMAQIHKDTNSGAITVPLKDAKDGTQSVVTIIEIRKGPIDIVAQLAKEEQEEKSRRQSQPTYSPPPPKPPSGRWSSVSG